MDKRFDGHTWCCTITSNIHNSQGLTFRKSLCVGQLVCNNKNCDFFARSSKSNEIEWSGQSNTPFKLGHLSPLDSTLVNKVCKVPPICINFCLGRIHYILGKGDMSRNAQPPHLWWHILDTIFGLIAQEVPKTPTAKNSAITMVASKEFLDKYLIYTNSELKKMLQGEELEDVLDKFEHLSSLNLQNIILLSRSSGKRGAYDSIMAMKTYTTIEYVHGNIFQGEKLIHE